MRLLPKILLAVVVPVALGAGAVLLVIASSWQRTLEEELVDSARRALVTRVDTVPVALQAARDTLRLLAGTPVLLSGDLSAIRSTLREWGRQNGQFENFYFLQPGGQAHPAEGEPFFVHERAWFPAFLHGDEVLAPPQVSPMTQQPVMSMLVPVFDDGGRLLGGLGGTVILGPLFERTVASGGAARADGFMLIDPAGRLLAGGLDGSTPLLQVPTAARAPRTAAVAEAVRVALAGDELLNGLRIQVAGDILRVLHAPVPMLSWRLLYVQSESVLLAPLADARRLAAVVVAAACAAALLLAALLHRLILQPVRHLAAAHERLQRGDWAARAPVAGGDEFADLAASFNRMADSLLATEKRFRAAFEAAPYAVTVSRLADGVLLDVNPAFERHIGYARSEAVGRNVVQLGIAADPAALRREMAQLRASGRLDNVEMQGLDRSGNAFRALYSSRLVELDGEKLVVTMSVDITRLKAAEEARRESEASFSALFELAPLPLSVTGRNDGFQSTRWNEAWYQTFGYPREAADNRSGSDIGLWLHPEDRDGYIAAVTAAGKVMPREVPMRRCDGSVRLVEVFGRMIRYGGSEQLMSVYVDVTDARQAEAELRARETRLRSLFEVSPVAILVLDLQGRIVEANQRFPEMLHYSAEEVLGRSYFDFVAPAELAAAHQGIGRMLEDGSMPVFSTERSYLRKDGSILSGFLSARRMPGSGSEVVLLVVISDLSELRRAEIALRELNEALDARVQARTEELSQALETLRRTQGDLVRSEKLAALGSLVAGVAHELNTPIGNSVTVASTLVEQSQHFAEELQAGLRRSVLVAYVDSSRRAAELLLANLQRAANLVTSFKQVAVDQTSEQRRSFEMAEVVDEILAMLNPQLKKRPLEIHVSIPPDLRLDSYPGPFGQVLANLIGNAAIHAFDDGRRRGTIRIEAGAMGDDGDEVYLSVGDDGIGIQPEHLDRIFDPFFTTRFGKGGSGLGLNIAYNIVTGILGGRIRVDSASGQGTDFRLELPRVAPLRSDPG